MGVDLSWDSSRAEQIQQLQQYSRKCIVPFHKHVNRTLNVLPFKNEQQKIQHTKFNMTEHDNDLKFFTKADTDRQLIYIYYIVLSVFSRYKLYLL